jgi:hypothetical protein
MTHTQVHRVDKRGPVAIVEFSDATARFAVDLARFDRVLRLCMVLSPQDDREDRVTVVAHIDDWQRMLVHVLEERQPAGPETRRAMHTALWALDAAGYKTSVAAFATAEEFDALELRCEQCHDTADNGGLHLDGDGCLLCRGCMSKNDDGGSPC